MQEVFVRTFALRFGVFPSFRAITEHVVRLETGATEYFLRGKISPLSRTLFLEKLASPAMRAGKIDHRTADREDIKLCLAKHWMQKLGW